MNSDALRSDTQSESRVSPVARKVRRSGVLSVAQASRVSPSEIASLAESASLPDGVTDVRMTSVHLQGQKLPNGDWSGLGGKTRHGPVWVIGGRLESEPVALFDHIDDGLELYRMLRGEEGELWQRKQRRLDAIAAAEARDAEEAVIAKENAKTVARSNEGGAGSSRRSASSAKPTASSGPEKKMRRASPRLSRTTSSPQ